MGDAVRVVAGVPVLSIDGRDWACHATLPPATAQRLHEAAQRAVRRKGRRRDRNRGTRLFIDTMAAAVVDFPAFAAWQVEGGRPRQQLARDAVVDLVRVYEQRGVI